MILATPKIAIIILYLNNYDALIACLRSCQNITYNNYEIILVENCSRFTPDTHADNGYSALTSLTIINNPENLGYARGNNIGIREALKRGADYVLLLNDDTVISPNCLNILVEHAVKSSHLEIIGPEIFYFDEPEKIWFAGARIDPEVFNIRTFNADHREDGEIENPIKSDYITGCALLISKEVIKTIGMLDERFFPLLGRRGLGTAGKKSGVEKPGHTVCPRLA